MRDRFMLIAGAVDSLVAPDLGPAPRACSRASATPFCPAGRLGTPSMSRFLRSRAPSR
jgi:hypothetical protein